MKIKGLMDKYTKAECNYREGDWPHECGTCVHFIDRNKSPICRIVHGKIDEEGLCSFWADGTGIKKTPKKIKQPGSGIHTDPFAGLPFPRSNKDESADFFDFRGTI